MIVLDFFLSCRFGLTLTNFVVGNIALDVLVNQVCTIDPMTPSFDPTPLIPYVEGLGLKYHYMRDDSE